MQKSGNSFVLSATDLSNHLSCQHLTQLNRSVALGELKKPMWSDPALEVLIARGREHEDAYIEFLKRKGLTTIDLDGKPLEASNAAMSNGVEVITQATLSQDSWMGKTDILLKVEGNSKFGNWSYEVHDTKLSQNTRASTILQLCLYTDLLNSIQGSAPKKMYVVKPGDNFPTEEFLYTDFQAYYRLVKKNFEYVINAPALQTYPDPVEHCNICRWWHVCDKKRHADDHLSLVAGIRTLQIEELNRQKIETLEQFANAEKLEKPERGNRETFIKRQSQAKVQLKGRIQSKLLYDWLPVEPGRGLNRLPELSKGDIYFDIEGDAFYQDGGLEYLLGYAYKNKKGELEYKKIWATNRLEEKKAFEHFMGFITEWWKRNPKMHIYHFAPYEPSAIKRLARVHATFETEVDVLLRAERFIDLHAVIKEALLASVERYSLKDVEKFTRYTRKASLHDASVARKSVECALELNEFKTLPKETLQVVEVYNEDDCLATEALHTWLEGLRDELAKAGNELERPELKTGEASENVQELDTRAQALYKSLIDGLPEDNATWNEEEKARWLLAHQIDYFRREDKSAWWEYFRVHELEYEELLDERKAITGLEFMQSMPLSGRERIPVHRYKYPPQEISLDEGDELVEVKGAKIGKVKSISLENHTIDITKTGTTIEIHPIAVHASERVDPGSLATSLVDIAEAIDEYGMDHKWPYHAAKDLLMKRKPKLLDGKEGAQLMPGEDPIVGAIRIAFNLDRSLLAIQGPPGSGKTYMGAKMILALTKAGKKIGVTAISHRVVRTLFDEIIKVAAEDNAKISLAHKPPKDKSAFSFDVVEEVKSNKDAIVAVQSGKVVGGTAWLWSDDDSRETLDYLFVDEAGQMSLSQVLAASRAAKNLILLGDPQQLEQPQRGSHPEGSDVAALTYLLDGHLTMPEDKGLFLAFTRRLHPNICQFTSEIFYESRLKSMPGLEKRVISGKTPFDSAGLFYVPVEHRGNQNKSLEEIKMVTEIVEKLLASGKWTNEEGETRALVKKDILIVAPYNAQVAGLSENLPGMRIGTVDKFQGQEAPVVIYSMTSSSPEDAPRGMGFLYNLNRLNVATSRAKSVCILISSPKILEPECKTIDQMRWANALCRYREMAS